MELPNGDSDLTMLAENVFDDILDRIKNSRLNFHLQISPFSAYISLKKSLQKDRSGAVLVPSLDCNEVKKLSSENMKLKSDLEKTHAELVSTSLRLKALESTLLVKSESKRIEDEILKIQAENSLLRLKNTKLSEKIASSDCCSLDLNKDALFCKAEMKKILETETVQSCMLIGEKNDLDIEPYELPSSELLSADTVSALSNRGRVFGANLGFVNP